MPGGRPAPGRDGSVVPLAERDRGLWNRRSIDEGIALITATLASAPLGTYQLQAAIAAVHAEATRAEDIDWRQIVALYQLLDDLTPSPIVTLNHAVAVAMAQGARAVLALLGPLHGDARMSTSWPPA
jgi:predicted RNA polymerase sigma factor